MSSHRFLNYGQYMRATRASDRKRDSAFGRDGFVIPFV
jgi:hypothetical protein